MSKATQKAQGEKTRKTVMARLRKRAKSPADIAEALPKTLKVSTAWVARLLKRAAKDGQATVERRGRAKLYRLPAPIRLDQGTVSYRIVAGKSGESAPASA